MELNKNAKRDMFDNIYEPVVKILSDKDMDFLRAIAADGSFGRISSIKDRLKMNDGLVQAYRKRLLDAGVISARRRSGNYFLNISGRVYNIVNND